MTPMRTLCFIFTAALAALAFGGCGGDGASSSSTASSSRDKAFDGALKFARCMRGEGLDFPDPQKGANGLVKIGGPNVGPNPNDPRLKAAQQKCGKYLEQGGGEARDPAQEARFQDAFLKYARCMRSQGVNVPDPKPGEGGGIVFQQGDPNAPDPESPAYKAADRKCHSLLAEVDKAVEVERSGP
jgi:hypothetical protein